MAADVDGSDTNETRGVRYLLTVALLTAAPLVLVSAVAGSPAAGLMALPAFGIVFGIEALRELVGWPGGQGELGWVVVVLVAPTTFAVPTAVSMRLDPTVPQTAMAALVFLLPVLTLGSYGVLAGADRWLRTTSLHKRWAGLALLGLILGGGPPAWVFVRSEVQEARVQKARQAVVEEAGTLRPDWVVQARVADVDAFGEQALVRARNSVMTVSAQGARGRTVRLSKRGLPFLDAGQLDEDSFPEMVVHGEGFNDTLRAFDHDGRLLWSYATPQGTLGSVAARDLDGDWESEVIAGSTTGGGLRLLTPSGRCLWADTTLWVSEIRAVSGGVFSVGDHGAFDPEDEPRLYVATSEAIRGYRGDGRSAGSLVGVDTLRPGTSRSGFAIGVPRRGSAAAGSTDASTPPPAPVLVAGAQGPELVAFALTRDAAPATERWRRRLPSSDAKLSARGTYLAAVGDDKGRIYVFDLRSGQPIAASSAGRTFRGVEWSVPSDSSDRPPVLFGWTRTELVGLRLPEARVSGLPFREGEREAAFGPARY